MINNLKLTQIDGRAMSVEPHALEIIESVSTPDLPNAKTGVWLMMEDGKVASALLTDKIGWVLQRLANSRPRVQLTNTDGGSVSIPVDVIRRAVDRENDTLITTSLSSNAGLLRLAVKESVEHIHDLVGISDDPLPAVVEPVAVAAAGPKPKPRRRKAAATTA